MLPIEGGNNNSVVIEDPLSIEQDKIFEDLLANCPPLEGIDLTSDQKITGKKRRRETTSSTSGSQEGKNESKKTIHREIERQRRKEMSDLYASLRSLLPLEYVKGKRSVSDHMHQASNYIKHMQKNIQELKMKRDKLKKLSNTNNAHEDQISDISDSSLDCVNVCLCLDGVEILISSKLNPETAFPLSKVLLEVISRGHNVISCVSTRTNEQSLHKIHIEANDLTCIDLSEFQERLTDVIKHTYL